MVVLLNGIALFDVAAAQTTTALKGPALVEALRKGGYNIYFRPEGNGTWTFVARISPQEWARLAAKYSDL